MLLVKIKYLKNAVSYVEAEGKLDIYTAPDYLEEIKDSLKRMYAKELILEFSKISYVASIGLRTILELHTMLQERNGTLTLKNVNDEILRAFRTSGFDKFLNIDNNPVVDDDSEEEQNT